MTKNEKHALKVAFVGLIGFLFSISIALLPLIPMFGMGFIIGVMMFIYEMRKR